MKTTSSEIERFPAQYDWEALFDELCRSHGLKRRQKRLLKSMSQALDVQPAARLFIEPDWFVAASKNKELQSRQGQLVELCETLFSREKKGTPKIAPVYESSTSKEAGKNLSPIATECVAARRAGIGRTEVPAVW